MEPNYDTDRIEPAFEDLEDYPVFYVQICGRAPRLSPEKDRDYTLDFPESNPDVDLETFTDDEW